LVPGGRREAARRRRHTGSAGHDSVPCRSRHRPETQKGSRHRCQLPRVAVLHSLPGWVGKLVSAASSTPGLPREAAALRFRSSGRSASPEGATFRTRRPFRSCRSTSRNRPVSPSAFLEGSASGLAGPPRFAEAIPGVGRFARTAFPEGPAIWPRAARPSPRRSAFPSVSDTSRPVRPPPVRSRGHPAFGAARGAASPNGLERGFPKAPQSASIRPER
jgi:hypothetical protein